MENYKKPKLKIKSGYSSDVAEDKQDMELQMPKGKPQYAPMSQSLKLIPPKGKTTRMTTEEETEPNIMDARAITNDAAKVGIKRLRLENEKKMKKKLQGME